jgi:hypothetical protein
VESCADPPLKYYNDVRRKHVDLDLEDVYVELTSSARSIWNEEPENYMTYFEGQIEISTEKDGRVKVGTATAYIAHLSQATNDGVSWFDVLDATSAEHSQFHTADRG